jgi:hypothetical protein
MHGYAVTYFGQGLRAQPQADPTTPLRQQPAQVLHPPPEQADHPLRRAAPATARRRAGRRRRPLQATGRNPLLFCIFDPRADGHRPQRDRRHYQILPGDCIRVRHLTALPVPAHRLTLAEARLIPTAQGIPRGIHLRGRQIGQQHPRFRMVGAPRHRQRARNPLGCVLEGDPHAHPSMPRSGRQAQHRLARLTGRREGRRGAHPHDGMELLRPDGVPQPGAPQPLIRQREDLLVERQRAAGPAQHPLPVRFPRARLVRRTPPVPPACGGVGGVATGRAVPR